MGLPLPPPAPQAGGGGAGGAPQLARGPPQGPHLGGRAREATPFYCRRDAGPRGPQYRGRFPGGVTGSERATEPKETGPGYKSAPAWCGYSSKPDQLTMKRPFLRSWQRQGFVHGRAAGSQPRWRLRGGRLGSEAELLLGKGESCAFRWGQREQLAQLQDLGRQWQYRPGLGAPCPPCYPDPFWEGEMDTGSEE